MATQTVNINSPLPVPAGAAPVSDGVGGFNSGPPSSWGENAALAETSAPATPIDVCSATITPISTGKIKVTVSGTVANGGVGPTNTDLWLTHTGGPAANPGDYQAFTTGLTQAQSLSCVVRYDLAAVNDLPIVFTIGVPVTFTLRLQAAAAGIGFLPHFAQINVEEVA